MVSAHYLVQCFPFICLSSWTHFLSVFALAWCCIPLTVCIYTAYLLSPVQLLSCGFDLYGKYGQSTSSCGSSLLAMITFCYVIWDKIIHAFNISFMFLGKCLLVARVVGLFSACCTQFGSRVLNSCCFARFWWLLHTTLRTSECLAVRLKRVWLIPAYWCCSIWAGHWSIV